MADAEWPGLAEPTAEEIEEFLREHREIHFSSRDGAVKELLRVALLYREEEERAESALHAQRMSQRLSALLAAAEYLCAAFRPYSPPARETLAGSIELCKRGKLIASGELRTERRTVVPKKPQGKRELVPGKLRPKG